MSQKLYISHESFIIRDRFIIKYADFKILYESYKNYYFSSVNKNLNVIYAGKKSVT